MIPTVCWTNFQEWLILDIVLCWPGLKYFCCWRRLFLFVLKRFYFVFHISGLLCRRVTESLATTLTHLLECKTLSLSTSPFSTPFSLPYFPSHLCSLWAAKKMNIWSGFQGVLLFCPLYYSEFYSCLLFLLLIVVLFTFHFWLSFNIWGLLRHLLSTNLQNYYSVVYVYIYIILVVICYHY